MKKSLIRLIPSLILILFLTLFNQNIARAQSLADNGIGIDFIVLYPGESRSINFEYNGLFWDNFAFHLAMVTTIPLDEELHTLSVNITPMGNDGTEFSYFSSGFFYGPLLSLEILAPRFPSGYEDVNYTVELNPFSVGFIFSTVLIDYPSDSQHDGDDFSYPIDMTMTLTLSN
jgi:hypothetical protein